MSDDPPSYRLAFPGLTKDNHILTSPEDNFYNCMGHATHTRLWWGPIEGQGGKTFWPAGAPHETTIEAHKKAFECLGYVACDNDEFEKEFEKIALFAKDNVVKHVARQLDERYWTSKLGRGVDISHALDALCGYNFGQVVAFMKKVRH